MSELQFFGHIIDNEEVESLDGSRFDVWNPWTREVWAQAAEASAPKDADRAVASARRAFDEGPWPRMGRAERAAAIHRLADLMEERADDLATARRHEHGQAVPQAKHDVARSVCELPVLRRPPARRRRRGLPDGLRSPHLQRVRAGRRRRGDQPVELPADDGQSWKIAPAIAWGNTCIIKPSEDTPASVTLLGRLAVEAGFPPGVLNVLNGHGARRARRSPRTTGSTG